MIMIESEWPGLPTRAQTPDGSSPVAIYVYVEDVDKTVERAITAGAKVVLPVQNQFWGDRIGWIMDPSGHSMDHCHTYRGDHGRGKAGAFVPNPGGVEEMGVGFGRD